MASDFLLWLTVMLGGVSLLGGAALVVLKWRGHAFRQSEEQRASEEGLSKLAQRFGTRWGMAANTDAHRAESPHASDGSVADASADSADA